MRVLCLLALALGIALHAAPGLAGTPVEIGWKDLVPPVAPYADPFVKLDNQQKDALRRILRLESQRADQRDQATKAEIAELRRGLKADGLDVDDLFRQRLVIMERRRDEATATNPDLADKEIRMPGYVLPLRMNDRKATEFLLVPEVGACIHTPTPPANQIVYVNYPKGFQVEGRYTPVWITGQMRLQASTQEISYVDGGARVDASYTMNAARVEPY